MKNEQRSQTVVFQGGLDMVSNPVSISPGNVIGGQNYYSTLGGYRRVDGYERYDGRPKPSQASYWLLGFDSGSAAITAGDTVTGDTSGATGTAVYTTTAETGSFGGGDAAGDLILYNVTGTFVDDEGLEVSAVNVATANGEAVREGEADDVASTTYLRAAIEATRADIERVPGEGRILGVMSLNSSIYAIRDEVGGAIARIYQSTANGWVEVADDCVEIEFESASLELDLSSGVTLTGSVSGATGLARAMVRQSGTYGGSDAAGYIVMTGQTGTFVAGEFLDSAQGSSVITAVGDSAAITLEPRSAGNTFFRTQSRYRSTTHNFFSSSYSKRLYVVSGSGYAFEFSGSVIVPIKTGVDQSVDKPRFVGVHNNHLLLGYETGQIMVSGTGRPLSFLSTDGATEFSLGEPLTGIQSSARTTTIITGRNKVAYLNGSDANDLLLEDISSDSGAIPGTLQLIGDPYFIDDRGLRGLQATDKLGDWQLGTETRKVAPIFAAKKTLSIPGTLRVRSKDQYRVYWEDGEGLVVYFGRGDPESMPVKVGFTPETFHSLENEFGEEILLSGDDDGWVYQLDSGTSADGEIIEAFLRFPYLHQGNHNIQKRYHRALIDVTDGGGTASALVYNSDVLFGAPEGLVAPDYDVTVLSSGGIWDSSSWGNFVWDAAYQSQAILELSQIGGSLGIVVLSDAIYEQPHTLSSMTIFYTPRRALR